MRLPAAALALAVLAAGCIEPQPCPTPLESCGGTCIDVRSDRLHCGSCATVCEAGLVCSGGACAADVASACPERIGGAFVTMAVCGAAVKLWVTQADFIDRAETLLATPDAPGLRLPVFDLRDASDCDAQWSWHPDPGTPTFAAATDPRCNACPAQVEADRAFWVGSVGTWCPSTATFLAVERR